MDKWQKTIFSLKKSYLQFDIRIQNGFCFNCTQTASFAPFICDSHFIISDLPHSVFRKLHKFDSDHFYGLVNYPKFGGEWQ